MAEQKSFQPTQKRLLEARRKGRVLKSQIFTQACVLMTVFWVLVGLIRYTWVRNLNLINYCFTEGSSHLSSCSRAFAEQLVLLVGGSLGAGALVAILIEALQVGVKFEAEPLSFNLERLDPVAGCGRLWSGLARGWRTVIQMLGLGVVLGWVVSKIVVFQMSELGVSGITALGTTRAQGLEHSLVLLVAVGGGTLLVLGGFEYLLNRRDYFRELSMSEDEVRREHREEEGDPHIKGARRSLHEALVLQDIERRVRKARVVIVERNEVSKTNST